MGDCHTIHGGDTMTTATMALLEYLRKLELAPEDDWLRLMVQQFTQALIELEAEAQIGAGRHERSPARVTQRNGYRERGLATRVGDLELRIPKLRSGSFFPSLLEPRRRAEKALLAVVQQAYVEGVSTRKVDDLLVALGLTGIDKSAVSRACRALDDVVEPFRQRPLSGPYPYVWLDALYLKVRQNHKITSQALVTSALAAQMQVSPVACARRASGKCWAGHWGPAKNRRFGRTFCAAWWGAAWPACSWSLAMPTKG
jgi:transposase-like protein